MQQISKISVDKLPNVGYLADEERKKQEFFKAESHIHEQDMLTGVKVGAHKLTNDIFTYFPKGFSGSKNSDFYEYLSLSMVPNIVGSVMMISLYSAASKFFNTADKSSALKNAKKIGAGVVLYALFKWAFQKITHLGIKASTGIDLDMKYVKKINELPENGREKGIVREQYPGVYDSVNFYRSDLLAKDGELNHGNIYYHDDRITQKAGYEEELNAPNQMASDKIKKVKARTTALENIGKYIAAATGVALGSQEAFGNIKGVKRNDGFFRNIIKTISDKFKVPFIAGKQLWKGSEKNIITRHYGKALVLGSLGMAFLTWLIPTIGFKHNSSKIKTKIDANKEYEVG